MKLLKIAAYYSDYLHDFYLRHPGIEQKSFADQKTALAYDSFGIADNWSHALTPLGYDVLEIVYNARPMQCAWAAEHSIPCSATSDLSMIAIAQAKSFRPDILWFQDYDVSLFKQIIAAAPSILLTLGWLGSAIPRTDLWRYLDIILSCAPESVEYLQTIGLPAALLQHGFDPRINERLKERDKKFEISFVGQLIRQSEFHLQREQMLVQLATKIGIDIFSPSAEFGWKDDAKYLLKSGIYGVLQLFKALGVADATVRSLPIIRTKFGLLSRPLRPVNPVLKPFLRPGVFGLDMYQVLKDSHVTLNIHADSSPRFASNMRLYETTGVGSCMVTDWKENLPELFTPDKETVVYRTADECLEKVSWLLQHPRERAEIAKAGQARTLRDHTYAQRALHFDRIIRSKLQTKKSSIDPTYR